MAAAVVNGDHLAGMRNYCTIFDSAYLSSGLLLYEALMRHSSRRFTIWILCLDEAVYKWFVAAGLPQVVPIRIADLEASDPAFAATRSQRTKAEYFFGAKSAFMSTLFALHGSISSLTYLDSDMYFFRDPEIAFATFGSCSAAITPHRFAAGEEAREASGIFNAGFVHIENNEEGRRCLADWRGNCISWCYDKPTNGLNADQGYLSSWPQDYRNVHVVTDRGVNAAPWNIRQSEIAVTGSTILIDGDPLTCFHFHALNRLDTRLFNPNWAMYHIEPGKMLVARIYQPYVNHCYRLLKKFGIDHAERTERSYHPSWVKNRTHWSTLLAVMRRWLIWAW